MRELNPLAQNVVQSFNYLLREKVLSPEDGQVVAGLMFELATMYKYGQQRSSGTLSEGEEDAALKTEEVVKKTLNILNISVKLD